MNGWNYQRYLASREWQVRRKAVWARCEGICERCGRGGLAAVHHLTYERIGEEEPEDLVGVCGGCHDYLGGERVDDPAQPRQLGFRAG